MVLVEDSGLIDAEYKDFDGCDANELRYWECGPVAELSVAQSGAR